MTPEEVIIRILDSMAKLGEHPNKLVISKDLLTRYKESLGSKYQGCIYFKLSKIELLEDE